MALTLVVERLVPPVLLIHGGAGAYLQTTTREHRIRRGKKLAAIVEKAHRQFAEAGVREAVLDAVAALEADPSFNAGYGARLQQDGVARVSAAIMDGSALRLSAVYNVRDCVHPSRLAAALQDRADRNLDGEGARALMDELGIAPRDLRSPESIARWEKLRASGDRADREAAIGDDSVEKARAAELPVPEDLRALVGDEDRHGTVGAVGCDASGAIWACTSTGGRGHEVVGRVSDTPTPAGTYACSVVGLSATGFGEQIIDLNVCGRIAARMLDGVSLEQALRRTFEEVANASGLLAVIAVGADGTAGYAHTTEACGVAWIDARGRVELDRNSY
ncbi:MAG TPA: isoaspartyl peptidase/L-asparaginase [Polyangiaceae bacterium]|nr:isoaspartyl peptidase/L-asparaginase [Polyangiaceae bacterium]